MTSLDFGEIAIRANDADLSSITGTHATYTDVDWQDGGFDASRVVAQSIYGRGREIAQLLEAYQTLLETKQSQIALVHGESGSGKTVLVEKIREKVCRSHGYFVAGKYVEHAAVQQEPYSAIMAAFSDLCDLTAQSSDFDERRRKKIQETLGSDAQLLVKAITNLSPFIGEVGEGTTESSFAKFKGACISFLRAMASDKHPVVIFIDDVQWADEGSRLIIEMLLKDSTLKNVMLVLAYRDEASSHVVDMLEHVHDHADVALSNLELSAVHQMVSSILGADTEQIRDLSSLVAKRTAGHPYHIKVYMEFALHEELLVMDEYTREWVFDVETLQEEIMVSESLASLLTRKIERLSPQVKEILKIASLLGYQFGGSILVYAACTAMDVQGPKVENDSCDESEPSVLTAVLSALSNAVKAGFVEATRNTYHFTHDKLRSSFRDMLDKPEEERLHASIGEAYLLSTENDESAIYNAAVHLNCAPEWLSDSHQRAKLAQINLDAAQYAIETSAFGNAVIMLRKGLDAIGPKERWSDRCFYFTFDIMLCLAKVQVILGDFEECEQTTSEAMSYSKTTEMKIKVTSIEIDLRAARSYANGLQFTDLHALAVTLGIKLPRKVSLRHVVSKVLRVKLLLRRKSDDDLLRLPTTDDLWTTTAMKLLVYTSCYGLLAEQIEAAVFSALLAMELTLKCGLSPLCPFAFAIYGVSQMSLGNTDCAYRFGKMALLLLVQLDSQGAVCPTFCFASTTLSCWKEPVRDLAGPLFQVGHDGFRHGDALFGAYCMSQSYAMQTSWGANLERLEIAMHETYRMVSEMDHSLFCLWIQPCYQHVINMRSGTGNFENVGILSGEIMSEEEYFQEAEEANNPLLTLIAILYKALEASYFSEFQLAASFYKLASSFKKDAVSISYGAPNYYWSVARVSFEMFQSSGQRRYLWRGRKYMKMLQRIETTGCPNATPYLSFLKALRISQQKSIPDGALRAAYDHGIARLAESGSVHLEGLMNERAGFDFAKRGKCADAEQYFDRAMDIYMNDWGSIAKLCWLQERSIEVLLPLKEEVTADTPRGRYITTSDGSHN